MRTLIGFPRMSSLIGYRRDFLPEFIHNIATFKKVQIYLENGYGSDLNFSYADYAQRNIAFIDREEIFEKVNIIISLTAPPEEDLGKMHSGQILLSMLHFLTHPLRNETLRQKNIVAISLDSLLDYEGRRMVQDFNRVAHNAVTEGFIQLRKNLGDIYWFKHNRNPIDVYILGFGNLGKEAASAALSMGNTDFQKQLKEKGGNPLVNVIPTSSLHSYTGFHRLSFRAGSLKINGTPHLLIDTSRRIDVTKPILKESELNRLPIETVIVDISADKYENNSVVKAIQGIPTGNEIKYVFPIDDSIWTNEDIIPKKYQLSKKSRRTVVSNYAWPSYGTIENRKANMKKYGYQILPIISRIIEKAGVINKNVPTSDSWNLDMAISTAFLA